MRHGADEPAQGSHPSLQRRSTVSGGHESSRIKITPTFRRITGRSHHDDGHSHKVDSDQATSQRWKGLRTTLNALQFMRFSKRKDDAGVQDVKGAELVAELSAGAPAAIILASSFQRDEKGRRRLPVLLEQLKVHITDSTRTSDRQHTLFRIELEYGSGDSKMKWVVYRDFRDFFNLHSRLRVLKLQQDIYSSTTGGSVGGHHHHARELPHFPRVAIPYLRGVRGLNDATFDDGNALRRLGLSKHSLLSVAAEDEQRSNYRNNTSSSNTAAQREQHRHIKFIENQRLSLEEYLKSLIGFMVFQGEANRICKFLELSAMGLRLSIENSFHGKEGPLTIVSTSSTQGWRTSKVKPSNIKAVFRRHGSKWFLIRHSYILVVNSVFDVVPVDVLMVDSDFKYTYKPLTRKNNAKSEDETSQVKKISQSVQESTKLRLTLKFENVERKMKVLTFSEKHMKQWLDSIDQMVKLTPWSKVHRFESFAPIRYNVSAQWFVDGRDYFWNVSHAIEMARDTIYIHDWWLSPEIYLRRPAHGNQQWRLDRLLKRKAEEGVKIFVILYRNVGAAIPIDSQYTKQSLIDLHPNVHVARSPNQFRQNILFWAHHEKLVLIDYVVAFVGGLDLCYGRWDTPQHVLSDDKPTGFNRGSQVDFGQETQLWVGKDYSNARVQDFYELNRPYHDMYDRQKIPRMPWHDVHMQIVGQPARDACRHFVQRWNYLIRQKRSTRPTPVLLPPPDFTDAELEALGHLGTCEVQLLRSACSWSLGFRNDKIEHSILNAYLKAIEQSEHFIYIENQFFISSTEFDGTIIQNEIGDALVERIMRAHKHDEDWRAVIVIPLMPGFEAEVDQQDGTSVRLIMQCQFRTISRGPHSIFARLERVGINSEDYIQFFSLRKWGKIGLDGTLVTEQLYIHAKIMIVDDRVAIIGSANINERSMRGNRDSEVAAFVRDTDQVESRMGGEPYMVGRFAHTLRVRLMREHLGIDVDALEDIERRADDNDDVKFDLNNKNIWQALQRFQDLKHRPQSMVHDDEEGLQSESDISHEENISDDDDDDDDDYLTTRGRELSQRSSLSSMSALSKSISRANKVGDVPIIDETHDWQANQGHGVNRLYPENNNSMKEDSSSVINSEEHAADLAGYGYDNMRDNKEAERNMKEAVKKRARGDGSGNENEEEEKEEEVYNNFEENRNIALPACRGLDLRGSTDEVAGPSASSGTQDKPTSNTRTTTTTTKDTMWQDIQALTLQSAESFLSDKEEEALAEVENGKLKPISPVAFEDPLDESFYYDVWLSHAVNNTNIFRAVFWCQPDNEVRTWKDYKEFHDHADQFMRMQQPEVKPTTTTRPSAGSTSTHSNGGNVDDGPSHGDDQAVESSKHAAAEDLFTSKDKPRMTRRRAGTSGTMASKMTTNGDSEYQANGTRSNRRSRRHHHKQDAVLGKVEAEHALQNVRGHLIVFPTDWLLKEDEA
ncbi:hypothetical protein V1514DRAFT_274630 [Lipomyces japonicus]|uniref:uncharacterized protein n=1 Tax=Lipomyces japonicus TaxID=56871 RepID=UPI0034CF81AC